MFQRWCTQDKINSKDGEVIEKRKVKKYIAEFKTKVVPDVLRQEQTQAETASKYQISAQIFLFC